jgi:hypothetical protein
MAEADKSTVTETASKPGASARANSSVTHPGLGMSAQLAMWMVVVTLCLIALPKGLVDSLPWSAANKSHMQIKDQMRALETRADAAVAAANDANTSARAAAACLAVMASGAKQAKSCAAGVAVPAQTLNSAASAQADPLRPVADIAKMTLDASKDKYDSIKDANDKLFSVLAAMGALLAFLGFKGLDSFMTAKSEAEKAVVEAQKAQEEADNVSHGIALREMAAVYKQGWDLQNHDKKPLPPLPPSGIEQYRAYLSKALYYLDAALQNRDDLDDILILRAMGTQCNVHRRLGDHEMALAIARQIIATYPKKDDSAYYNAACYCSLIGQRWATTNESAPADFSVLALGYLREAIVLEPENKKEAMGDTDFTWLKSAKGEEFNELVK